MLSSPSFYAVRLEKQRGMGRLHWMVAAAHVISAQFGLTACAPIAAEAAGEWSIAAGEGAEPLIEPPDVTEERLRIVDVDDYVENPLVIRGLHKVYPAQDGQAPKVCAWGAYAVNGGGD